MIEFANLPSEKVCAVLYGERYKSVFEEPLKKLGIESFTIPDYPKLPTALAGHIDLICTYIGNGEFVVAESMSGFLKEKLKDAKIYEGNDIKGPNYPNDVSYNVAIVGKYALLNIDATDELVKNALINAKVKLIDCKQGYAKCSVCVVDENSIITADIGIKKKAESVGMNVLLIEPGGIELPGYNYGFIGGASIKLSKNILAFTGTIEHLVNADKIKRFLSDRNIEIIYLTDKKIFDVGSIIPIK